MILGIFRDENKMFLLTLDKIHSSTQQYMEQFNFGVLQIKN